MAVSAPGRQPSGEVIVARKKMTPVEEAALAALGNRLIDTLTFMEDRQDFPSGPQIRSIVEGAMEKRDMRTLRLIERDVDDMALTLAPHEREGLEAVLLTRYGLDKEAQREELRSAVAAVLARGTVASEKERVRLLDYAGMLEVVGGDPAEIQAVRQLAASG